MLRYFRVRKVNLEKVKTLFPSLVVCEPPRTIGANEFNDGWEQPLEYTDEYLQQFVGVRLENVSGNQFHKALVAAGIVKKRD